MMSWMKKLSAALLAAMMLLAAGCAGPAAKPSAGASAAPGETGAQQGAMGRYVEQDITPKPYQSIAGPAILPDGSLAIWGTLENGPVGELAVMGGDGQWTYTVYEDPRLSNAIYLAADEQTGGLMLMGYFQDEQADGSGNAGIFSLEKDGTARQLPVDLGEWFGQGLEPNWCAGAADNRLVVGGQTMPTVLYAADGSKLKELTPKTGRVGTASGNVLYMAEMMSASGKDILHFNLQTLEEPQLIEAPATISDYNSAMALGKDGALYLALPAGLYRLVEGGTLWEQLIEGSICSLGDPSMYLVGMKTMQDGQIYTVMHEQDGGAHLLGYRWDSDIPASPSKELNVVSLTESDSLRKAATILQNQNPDVRVNVRALIGRDDGEQTTTVQDAVRILNTELLSGKGGDIIMLDGLDVRRYINKGMLKDLTDWAQPHIDSGEWLPSVAQSLKNEQGKIYSIPARFTFQSIWGKPEEVAQITSFEKWLEFCQNQPGGRPALSLNSAAYWVNLFYPVCSPAWPTDAQGRIQFDSDAFTAFLEGIRTMTGGQFANPKDEMEASGLVVDEWMRTLRDEVAFLPSRVSGFSLSDVPYSINRDRAQGNPGIAVLPGQASGVFTPVQMLGVNAQSAQPELAMQFMDIVFSSQVQDLNFYDGFPIRTASLDSMMLAQIESSRKKVEEGVTGGIGMYGYEESVEVYPINEATIRALRKVIDTLDTAGLAPDATVLDFVLEESEPFFEGHKSAREVAQALQKRLAAYLTE